MSLMVYVVFGIFFALFIFAFVFFIFYFKKNISNSYSSDYVDELKRTILESEKNIKLLENSVSNLESRLEEKKIEINSKDMKISSLNTKIMDLSRDYNELEAVQNVRDAETDSKLNELKMATESLAKERERVIADEKRRQEEFEINRDRIWSTHETNVISKMKEISKKSSFQYSFFDNSNLPENFDLGFKPDFMIEFLDQYVIFDAKQSKSKNINSYIQNQVKDTVDKIKRSSNCDDIFNSVFLVVPTIDLAEIKEYSHYYNGYNVYVISVEAFEPILASFKKIESYDIANDFNPQERENIVDLIALFDNHIRQTSATNILTAMNSLKVLSEKSRLSNSMNLDVENVRSKIKLKKFKENDLKKLISNPENQIDELKNLVVPKEPLIDVEDI